MTLRVGINGLGRIGRCVARAIYETGDGTIELVAVNGTASAETHAHMLRYDSVHGRFHGDVKAAGEHLEINGRTVTLSRQRDPAQIAWGAMGVEVVLECTGKFNTRSEAARHLEGGAKKVLISAPAEQADATVVFGVNHAALKAEHKVVSVGSCTTNGLAPLAKVLHDAFGIESGFMTTVHAYTGDQNLVDNNHKDLRRARAAALSIIPTSTGAARTIGLILPELNGRLDGVALRVPTPNVSLIDLTFNAGREVTREAINEALSVAAEGALKGVLGISSEPLVSIDYTHSMCSSIADLTGTKVTGGRLARVASWYDNEWAFSCRMLDVARLMAGKS